MGAYSPAHLLTSALEEKILNRLIKPTIDGMAKDGNPFSGVLFAGVMVVKDEPYLIEYNARFGDPECQTLMLRYQGDLLETLLACAQARLADVKDMASWSDQVALCVVMAANGYPGAYKKNTVIEGLSDVARSHDVTVFHAGTARDDGDILAIGGRVLGVTALGRNIAEAQQNAYQALAKVRWPDGFYRKDIGWEFK